MFKNVFFVHVIETEGEWKILLGNALNSLTMNAFLVLTIATALVRNTEMFKRVSNTFDKWNASLGPTRRDRDGLESEA